MIYCEILFDGQRYRMGDDARWAGGDRQVREFLNGIRGEWLPSQPHPATQTLRTLRGLRLPFRVVREEAPPTVRGRVY